MKKWTNTKPAFVLLLLTFCSTALFALGKLQEKEFKVGLATSNITPRIGMSINGGFQDGMVRNIHDETHAKALVMNDGNETLAIVVVDLCMIYRKEIDEAKRRANEHTQIPIANIMVSATHTHSSGTACSVFQSDPEEGYLTFLSERIGDAIIRANANLVSAKIGWNSGQEPNQVFNRRWRMKPGTPMINPFGGQDQVKMNPGVGHPDLLEAAGPTDPEVWVLSFQTLDGKPLGVFSNYSLHYVGGVDKGDVSADYFGIYGRRVQELLIEDGQTPDHNFLAVMSNGTSGDINNVNWAGKEKSRVFSLYEKMYEVANDLAKETVNVLKKTKYHSWVSLKSAVKELQLNVRLPDQAEIKRANEIIAKAKDSVMKTSEEVYARETVLLNDYPKQVNVLLQCFKIGDLAINAIPAEVFVEIGLHLKKKSPFASTFTVSLANGYNGYLPTPEQHKLGGYETWRARSSYLEENASTRITSSLLELQNKLK